MYLRGLMGLCKRKPIPLTGKPKTGKEARALAKRLKQNRRIRAEPAAAKTAINYLRAVKGPFDFLALKVIRKASLGEAVAGRRRRAKALMELKARTSGKARPKQ